MKIQSLCSHSTWSDQKKSGVKWRRCCRERMRRWMRWEEAKCLWHTWTGEWWMNLPTSQQESCFYQSINNDSKPPITPQGGEKARPLSHQTSLHKPACENSTQSKWKWTCVRANLRLSPEKSSLGFTLLFLLRDKQTDICQLVSLVFSLPHSQHCPAARPVFGI